MVVVKSSRAQEALVRMQSIERESLERMQLIETRGLEVTRG